MRPLVCSGVALPTELPLLIGTCTDVMQEFARSLSPCDWVIKFST